VLVVLTVPVPCGRVADAAAPPCCADALGVLEPGLDCWCAAGSVDAVVGEFMLCRLLQQQHAITMAITKMNAIRIRPAMVVICVMR
jgi:hypothetical protein